MDTNQTRPAETNGTQALGKASSQHAGQALIVQGYALSVMHQPMLDFTGFTNLKSFQDGMNGGIGRAKNTCEHYLNRVLPGAIETITNIDAYFQVQNALSEALQPDTDARSAIALLKAVQDQATDFRSQANGVVTDLQGVRDRISANAMDFNTFAKQLDVVLNGDNGVLSSINEQLGSIDSKIAGAATGVALSALAVAGGVVMIVIGAATELVTGGASTALVLGGVGVLAAGVGGEVGSSIALAKMLEMKNDLLRQQAQLSAEAAFASGMVSGFRTLSDQAAAAVEATQGMANAWTLLGSDLGGLASHLERGETTVPALRRLFTVAAQGDVRTIQSDVTTIRGQLVGVRVAADPKTNVVSLVQSAVRGGLRLAA